MCGTRAAGRLLVKLDDKKIYARVAKVIGEMQACIEEWTSVYDSRVYVCLHRQEAYVGSKHM